MACWHKVEQFQHFVQRTLIQQFSFDSESVKDITFPVPDIVLQKFNYTSIELGGVRSKQFLESFSTSQASFRAKIPSQSTRQSYEFLGFKKCKKKLFQLTFFQIPFVISQSRHNKLQKRQKISLHRYFNRDH